MTHVLHYAARTDRGLLRANNQDSVFAGDRLLVIADGMGGHAAGDVASRLVVAAFVDLDELAPGSDMVRPLTDATRDGNAAIAEMVDENPELDGMGTTLTALLFDGPVVALAHVGDSRAYLYRNGVLHQISHDDTFVQSLVDDGRITADEAAHHPQRSLLLRALNGTEMDPSITMRETSPGDRFLICSDGLSDVVSPEAIADALAGSDPDQVADTLIQLALVGGGPDNVTVIVADVIETGGGGGFGIGGGIDPEATGPMQPIHLTQKMPRVPLPPIPEDIPAKPEYAVEQEGPDRVDDDDDFDDDDFDDPVGAYDAGDEPGEPGGDGLAMGRRMLLAPPHARWRRRWAFGLALVVLLGVGLTGSLLWANSKYYVGDHNDEVAVFRGVNGSLLGWRFASVQENSCTSSMSNCRPLKVGDLVQAARDQVNAGIPVGTLTAARAVINRLTSQQLPPCPTTALVPAPGAVSSGPASTTGAPVAPPVPDSGSRPSPAVSPTTGAATRPVTTPARTSSALPPRTTPARATPTVPPRTTTSARSAAGALPPKTTPGARTTSIRATTGQTATGRTTTVLKPPPPVRITVTVTVSPAAVSGPDVPGIGQHLRIDRLFGLAPNPAPTAARVTTPAVPPTAVRPTPVGPVTRAEATAIRPTITIFTTTTLVPTPTAGSDSTSEGTPLISPAAQPGITCRLVS